MRVTAMKKSHISTGLSVDHPRQNERVTSPVYTLRITAPSGVKSVELCINHGTWKACRHSVGYWWHDWSGYGSGEHEVIARVMTSGDEVVSSEPHEFLVDLEPHLDEANA